MTFRRERGGYAARLPAPKRRRRGMARVYERFLRQRLSRRRLLRGAAGATLGAAGVALVGCAGEGGRGQPSRTGTPVAEGTPRPGGTLRLRQDLVFPNLSPLEPGLANVAQGLFTGFTVFDHLWYVPTDTGGGVPLLATDHQ